jgi:elongation factor 1-beta
VVFDHIKKQPDAKYVNALRWYKHIASYSKQEKELFEGEKKAFADYVKVAKAPKKEEAAEEDDDDIDLFGSDEEEDEEKQKLVAKRLEEYHAKKAASKYPTRVQVVMKPAFVRVLHGEDKPPATFLLLFLNLPL